MKINLLLLLVASSPIWVMAQINSPQLQQQSQQSQQAIKSPCKAGAFGVLINPFSPADGWRCLPAPPGYFATAGSTEPILCPVGTISYGNAESCKRMN
jgi:hypothetical protein